MATNQKLPQPAIPKTESISKKVHFDSVQIDSLINFNFSKFSLKPIKIQDFNNHFKDKEHIYDIAVNFIGQTLPIISRHNYSEISAGAADLSGLHFHPIGKDEQPLVRNILLEYGFNKPSIEQMFEGNALYQFSGTMGHVYPVRIVCHKLENALYPLFFDTNHHIYMNKKYVKESLFFEKCPSYLEKSCNAMKYLDECFAFAYLDTEKVKKTYGFSTVP